MAVVIDEVESTVEPNGNRGQSSGESGAAKAGPQPFALDKLAAEFCRLAERQARLKAD